MVQQEHSMKRCWIEAARVAAVALSAISWAAPGAAQNLLPSQPSLNGTLPLRDDRLPSWNDTTPKKAIVSFVERVTTQGTADFVPAAERIATFDNDGTLWAEQPIYFQVAFALD